MISKKYFENKLDLFFFADKSLLHIMAASSGLIFFHYISIKQQKVT